MIKENNEITVRIKSNIKHLTNILENRGFKYSKSFSMDDTYYVKKDVVLNDEIRKILSEAIILRIIYVDNVEEKKLVYKVKDFVDEGNIVSQKAYNLVVLNEIEASLFLEKIGYKKLMNIKENDLLYTNGIVEIAIKNIEEKDLLIEIETNEQFDTTDKLINYLNELDLPFEKNTYFVKKAEDYYRRNIMNEIFRT